MLVLVSGGPPVAHSIFHENIDNLVNGLFKQEPDPIFTNPTNQGQVAMNELHAKHPNIVQNDLNIAHQAVTIACVQSFEKPNNPFATGLCSETSHNILTKYLNDWGYDYMIGTSTTLPPQLLVK